MENPFDLSDDKLSKLLDAYTAWRERSEEDKGYVADQEKKAGDIKGKLLNETYLSKTPDEQLIQDILNYSKTLEGPAHIRIGEPRVTAELEKIRRNLRYLIDPLEEPIEKAARILEGDYKIPVFAKAFWTPVFQAQYPDRLPNWNNKTENFLKKVGVDIKTSKLTIKEKYEILSDAFQYLRKVDPKQDFYTLNHLMHYGTAIKEGAKLVEELLKPGRKTVWWVNQGASLKVEREGGFLWAPLETKGGQSVYHWDALEEVEEGDIVVHYANGALRYVSEVISQAVRKERPQSLKGGSWDDEGRLVQVRYHGLEPPIPYQSIFDAIKNVDIEKGPIDSQGGVKQGYFFRFTLEALRLIQASEPNTKWPDFAIVTTVTQDVINWIQKLHTYVDEDGKLPYKPLVLLSVLRLLDADPGHAKRFKYEELYSQFSRLLEKSGFVASETRFCQPYARMANDSDPLQVWIPELTGEDSIDDSKCKQPSYVRNVMRSVRINDSLWPVFSSTEGRQAIQNAIFDKWPGVRWAVPDSIIEPKRQYRISDCAEDTGFGKEILNRWVRAIERKGQAVLYGPPGTGKTFIAEHLAKHLVGGGYGFYEIVQFHPAYAYEDFVQGIRPKAREDGGLEYPVVPGRFLEFCEKAEGRQGKCVLIIDEINRANLARVFGELMYLLEYRDKEVPLASGGFLHIPENVRMIGTMNTADRSIALVDHALRRRFAFLALYPNYEILRNYHKETGFNVEPLINVLNKLNTQIGDRHYEVGISFFLREDLSDQIEDIWRMEIEPYLEEYFFDQPDKTEAYRWEKVSKEVLP